MIIRVNRVQFGLQSLRKALSCYTRNTFLSRRTFQQTWLAVRHHNFDGETYTKTNMYMMTKEDETHTYIAAFSPYGFRMNSGFHVLGPCAVFPRAIVHWNVASASKITPESLSLFCMLEPKPDILIIGKGDWDAQIDKDIVRHLRSKKINVEILPTEQACSTFNFLNSERRVVAAALIPPMNMAEQEDFVLNEGNNFYHPESIHRPEDEDIHKTMEMFRDRGVMETLASGEMSRKRSHSSFRERDEAYKVDKDKES